MKADTRTFGTVTHDAATRKWLVECEPHVAIKLKRVFGRLGTRARDVHALSDTPEVARDLVWFMERYPLRVEDAKRLRARAREHEEQTAIVEDLLARRAEVPAFDLAVPAREYQREAAAMLLASGGLLLADDVGIGKTCSAICTLTDPRTLPGLVVTLTHLPEQWRREIYRFAPKLRVHIIQGTKPYRLGTGCKKKHAWIEDALSAGGARCRVCGSSRDDAYHGRTPLPDVIVINYHKLAAWAETLAKVIRSVIYDEVQELRHQGSQRYSAAEVISAAARFRLGLSATPIFNYGSEIHSVLQVLRPDALGTRPEFVTEWCLDEDSRGRAKIKEPKAFGIYMRDSGLMLRRTRADVGRELPPISMVPHHIEANMAALESVSDSCGELARFILGLGPSPFRSDEAVAKGAMMLASEELSIKLRQATGIAKAPFVAEFVRMLVESGEKVVLFGWHREVYRIWREKLEDLSPVFYTGTETPHEKEEAKDAFVNGSAKILIMSLRAGAGLDGLQGVCRTGVFRELDYSPGVHEQCGGRIARDGQTDPVVLYYLLADTGSDPIVADILGVKQSQIHGLRDPKAELVEKLDAGGQHVKRLAEAYLAQVAGGRAA